jgi:hypothetical protein
MFYKTMFKLNKPSNFEPSFIMNMNKGYVSSPALLKLKVFLIFPLFLDFPASYDPHG